MSIFGTLIAYANTNSSLGQRIFEPMVNIPFLTSWQPGTSFNGSSGAELFNTLFKLSIQIGAVLAVAMFIYGGVLIIIARDRPSEYTKGKKRIKDAILGLLMLLSTYIVLALINPQLLKLDILKGIGKLQAPKEDVVIGGGYDQYKIFNNTNNGDCPTPWVHVDSGLCGSGTGQHQLCCGRNNNNQNQPPSNPPHDTGTSVVLYNNYKIGQYCDELEYGSGGESFGYVCAQTKQECEAQSRLLERQGGGYTSTSGNNCVVNQR